MKKFATLLLLSLFLISCTSSQKMLDRGQYDRAIDKAAEKLRKKPNNEKELNVLKEAYELANMFDRERIEFLELEGREESWVEIYRTYEEMNRRQNVIRTLPSRVRNEFTFYNYDNEIIESKRAAAEVSYKRGLDFLERGDKISARQAWNEFDRAAEIYPGYEDVDIKLAESHRLGMNNALYFIENNSGMVLPDFFDAEMKKVTLRELNTHWLNFDTYENDNIDYDYFLVLNITEIAFSPESVERRIYKESREIQDGMRYEYDSNGNVKKDSTGTDIRVPNMVIVEAEITETEQSKSAFVAGSLDFYDLRSDQLIKTESASIEAVFRHRYARFSGNREALSEETEKIIGGREAPFPGNEQMMMDATELLKNRSKSIISRNRRLLEN
ncbi:tetratricopeptide repeat protein [Rhodohalobacter halophilus]|uniref:tetratricopeptide repeat protein n=1 Tax=Rhodohalobacter halophilus TaxID=1812810 RepID=UPI00114CC009|nr:hypothetical protein [Rhodohalobacter halophilus]